MNEHMQTKVSEVAALREHFAKATATVFLDYTGIDVETITALRVEFRKAGVGYLVAKNTLVKQALKGTALEGNKELYAFLKGPSGLAFSYEDPSAAAKTVKAFRKANENNEKLKIKCGVLETAVMNGAAVEATLATMPGKNEIRSMLLATLLAPAQSLVRVLAAPAQNLAYVLSAQETKLNQ